METALYILIGVLLKVTLAQQQTAYIENPSRNSNTNVIDLSSFIDCLMKNKCGKGTPTEIPAGMPQYVVDKCPCQTPMYPQQPAFNPGQQACSVPGYPNQCSIQINPCNQCPCAPNACCGNCCCRPPCYDPMRSLFKKLKKLDKRVKQLCEEKKEAGATEKGDEKKDAKPKPETKEEEPKKEDPKKEEPKEEKTNKDTPKDKNETPEEETKPEEAKDKGTSDAPKGAANAETDGAKTDEEAT